MAPRQLSQAGAAFIQQWESLQLVGMLPTPVDAPTAGWGHTGPDVVLGKTYTMEQINAWFAQDTGWATTDVNDSVEPDITQHQFDACVSLCFNIGPGDPSHDIPGWLTSTVLRKINAGDIPGAAEAFKLWTHQNGSFVQGLLNRRTAERALFLTP